MPKIGTQQIFPSNSIWNTPVDALPVQRNSAALVASIGPTAGLRCDDAIPINIVTASTPLVPVAGMAAPDSDGGGYPISATALIEGGAAPGQPGAPGTDSHFLAIDDRGILYEIFDLRGGPGSWTAYSAAKYDLNSNALRPVGWTSADAAGLPILPGLVRYDEIAAGQITHCLRMTVRKTLYGGSGDPAGFVWPARHYAAPSSQADVNLYPAMGQRFRLKASFDISGFSATNQIVLEAMKKYGAMVADNGLPWACQHDADPRWNDADMALLHSVVGSNFEAVDATVFMGNADSGATGSAANMLLVTDALGRPNAIPFGNMFGVVNGQFVTMGVTASAPVVAATSVFSASAVPILPWKPDAPVTLGMVFQSSVDATVKGVRFYKGLGNGGPHTGLLYSMDGKETARASFVNEGLIGWQACSFAAPVPIKANVPYVVALYTTSGYALDRPDAFGAGIGTGSLRGLKGIYSYGAVPTFPVQNYQDSNYWVDVVLG